MTKFIVNNRTDAWKSDFNIFVFTITKSHKLQIKFMCLYACWQWELANECAWISAAIVSLILWARLILLMISVRSHVTKRIQRDIYLPFLFSSRAGAVWRWQLYYCRCLASLGYSGLWRSTRIPSFSTTSSPSPTHCRYFISGFLNTERKGL